VRSADPEYDHLVDDADGHATVVMTHPVTFVFADRPENRDQVREALRVVAHCPENVVVSEGSVVRLRTNSLWRELVGAGVRPDRIEFRPGSLLTPWDEPVLAGLVAAGVEIVEVSEERNGE
jgi:hypothetical protein